MMIFRRVKIHSLYLKQIGRIPFEFHWGDCLIDKVKNKIKQIALKESVAKKISVSMYMWVK